jgi:hypothetical protein
VTSRRTPRSRQSKGSGLLQDVLRSVRTGACNEFAPPGKSALHDTMQQMLWIFWAIAAGIHNLRLHPHTETKKATNGNLAASGAEQHVPVLTTSRDQLAVLRPAFFLFLSLCGQLSQKTTPSGSDKRCCLFTVGSSYFHASDRIRPANRAASKFSCDLFPKDRFFHVYNFN